MNHLILLLLLADPFPKWTVRQCGHATYACYTTEQAKLLLKLDIDFRLAKDSLAQCEVIREDIASSYAAMVDRDKIQSSRLDWYKDNMLQRDKQVEQLVRLNKTLEEHQFSKYVPWVILVIGVGAIGGLVGGWFLHASING